MKRLLPVALAMTMAAPSLALAGSNVQKGTAPAAAAGAAEAIDVKIERLRTEGFTALYSLDYAGASRAFDEVVRVAPDRPEGYIWRATNIWFKGLFDQRLLSTSLYSSDEYYAQKEKKVDPAVDKAYRADIAKAIQLGEARVKANPKDVTALYYLGAAHGALGGYEATMARAFVSALKHGSKSVDLHEKVIDLDKTFADAYLTIGMYHYVVGSLPFAVKMLVFVGGVTGSKKDGLAELERVAREGRHTSDDARVILVSLYEREGRREDALKMLGTLAEKYPSNYLIGAEQANTLAQLGRYDEAYAAFDRLLANERATAAARDYLEFSYAQALRAGGKYDAAIARYERVWTWKSADSDLVTLARLGAGQCHDALGRRQEAVAQYKIVLARPDVLDSKKKAETYSKKAYSPSSPMASTGQL